MSETHKIRVRGREDTTTELEQLTKPPWFSSRVLQRCKQFQFFKYYTQWVTQKSKPVLVEPKNIRRTAPDFAPTSGRPLLSFQIGPNLVSFSDPLRAILRANGTLGLSFMIMCVRHVCMNE